MVPDRSVEGNHDMEDFIVKFAARMMSCQDKNRRDYEGLQLVMKYPSSAIPFEGYRIEVVVEMGESRTLADTTETMRSVLGIIIKVQHPDPLVRRLGPTEHQVLDFWISLSTGPITYNEYGQPPLVLLHELEDCKHLRYVVDSLVERAYLAQLGVRNWEVSLGGLRGAVPDHWSLQTPSFEDWKRSLE